MSRKITLTKDLSGSKLKFGSELKVNPKTNAKSLSLLYNAGGGNVVPLVVQTSNEMTVMIDPYPKDKPEKYYVKFVFKENDQKKASNNAKMLEFMAKLQEIDDAVIDWVFENSKLCFKKKFSDRDVVKELYKPLVRPALDKDGNPTDKWAPTLRANAPFVEETDAEGNISRKNQYFTVYNEDQEEVNLFDLNKIFDGRAVIGLAGLWFGAGNTFGMSLRIQQMQVKVVKRGQGFAFVDEEEDLEDDSGDDALVEKVVKAEPTKKKVETQPTSADNDDVAGGDDLVDDSDNETDPVHVPVEDKPKRKRASKAQVD
jgi:hypothetical protein